MKQLSRDPHYTAGTDGSESKKLNVSGAAGPTSWSPSRTLRNSLKMVSLEAGSVRASTLTVITSMVGAGTLALPMAVQQLGVVLYIVLIIVAAWLALMTCQAVVEGAVRTGTKTYPSLIGYVVRPWMKYFAMVLVVLQLYGASTAYMLCIKNLLPQYLKTMFGDGIWTNGYFLVAVTVFGFVLPIGLFRSIAILRYTSLFGLLMVLYCMVTLVTIYFDYCGQDSLIDIKFPCPVTADQATQCVPCPAPNSDSLCMPFHPPPCFMATDGKPGLWSKVKLVGDDPYELLQAMSVIFTTFAPHITVLAIYVELRKQSAKRMWRANWQGVTLTAFIYIVMGLFGYFTFLTETQPNIMADDYHANIAVMIGGIGVCTQCLMALPLMVKVARDNLGTIFKGYRRWWLARGTSATDWFDSPQLIPDSAEESHDAEPAFVRTNTPVMAFAQSRSLQEKRATNPKPDQLSNTQHVLFTLIFVFAVGAFALSGANLSIVFGIMGATLIPTSSYILPTWVLLKTYNPGESRCKKYTLTISTAVIVVLALVSFVMQMMHHTKGSTTPSPTQPPSS